MLLAGFAAQNASAAFVWDLRATALNGVPLDASQAKAIPTVVAGDVLTIGLWAMITGSSAAAEGFQSGLGKTITTHFGGAGGNQGAPAYESNVIPPGGPLPTIQDLNADGFMDLGTTAATTSSTAGLWFPRTPAAPGFEIAGTAIPNGTEFKLFHFTYTVINPGTPGAGGATIQFLQQTTTIINSAAFSLDGSATATVSKSLGTSTNPVGQGPTLGLPVSVGVPEPSAFGMVALGAMSLLGFRRLGTRRS